MNQCISPLGNFSLSLLLCSTVCLTSLVISGPDQLMVNKARELAEDLLVVVREEYAKSKGAMEQWQQQQAYSSGLGQYPGGYSQVSRMFFVLVSRDIESIQQYGQAPPAPSGQPPPAPPSDGQNQASQDQYAAYWAQISSNPEYAA